MLTVALPKTTDLLVQFLQLFIDPGILVAVTLSSTGVSIMEDGHLVVSQEVKVMIFGSESHYVDSNTPLARSTSRRNPDSSSSHTSSFCI